MKNYKGGFSKGVIETEHFKEYTSSGCVCGYLGERGRTKEKDQILEKHLRTLGLEDWGITSWLTSTTARHMMSDVTKKTKAEEFLKIVEDYTKTAFTDVIIWGHPDHRGSLSSTMKLRKLLKEAVSKELKEVI